MKSIKKLLANLIGSENILSNNILFIDFTGSHEKGQFLSQLFYWSSRTKRKDGFFAKTYDEWHSEIRVKKHSIRRFAKEFKEAGFLEIEFWKFNGVPTLHYRLNQDKLIEELINFCEGNNLSVGNTELHRGLQIVTLEGDTELPSIEGDTELPSINRDYHILHTDTTTEARACEKEIYFEQPFIDLEKFPWERATDFLMDKFKTHQTTRSQIKAAKDSTEWKGTVKDFRKLAESLFRDAENNREKYGRLLILPDNEEKYWAWLSKVMARLKTFMEFRVRDQKKDEPKKMKYDRVLK